MDDRTTEFQAAYSIAAESQDKESAFTKVAQSFPDKWCELSQRLVVDGEDALALKHLDVALKISSPNNIRAGIINDIGRVHANSGRSRCSLGYFEKALQLNPSHPGILANIALVKRWTGELAEAERWLKRALASNPWESTAALELSFVKMLQGDYSKGFELYETRWRTPGGTLRKLICDKPEWDGHNGKNVFIYGEQGSGDIFLMLRYAKMIRERGVRQSWVVHKSMLPLVSTIPEIDFVFCDGDKTPDFDCHFPAASLPRLFGTTIDTIPAVPCIPKPEPHDYGPGYHVGIVWRGSKAQLNDKIRSTNLEAWLPVLNVPGVKFHSIQVDGRDEALVYPQIEISDAPKDWLETARRVCGLDLMISVDTSMVHLCGSLGVECWCALHCRPYFVFPLVREDCPWYPTVKLFKQRTEFEWKPVFESIANEIKTLLPR